MKKLKLSCLFIFFLSFIYSQNKNANLNSDELLKELSNDACLCIDSIPTTDVRTKIITSKINKCIDKVVGTYQIGSNLKNIHLSHKENMQIKIKLDTDKNSSEYKRNYKIIEEYLMVNCNALRETLATNDVLGDKSVSKNDEAVKAYRLGNAASKKENHKEAIDHYKKAIEIDPEFVFAYDNLGLSYRKLEDFDNAITAYQKSLEIDPNGKMPLQNIAVAYQYKKEYNKAIEADKMI